MAKISELLVVTEEEKNAILKHFHMDEKDVEEKVDFLIEHQIKNGLPQDEGFAEKVRVSLFNNKMSTERSKQYLQGYYELRTRYPHVFQKLIPGTDFYEYGKKYMRSVLLPRLTPDLCRITIYKHHDPEGNALNAFVYIVTAVMQAELRMKSRNECFLSNILILDFEEITLKNLLKYTPTINNQMIRMLIALKLRLKNIHLINHSPLVDKLMVLVKALLPSKFHSRIVSHNSFDSLYEYIPKEYLPKDYGGDELSIEELHHKWCEVIESEKEYFTKLVNVKCDISSGDTQDYETLGVGVEGSFKKLNID